jgi:class 3 adenylate cyclase
MGVERILAAGSYQLYDITWSGYIDLIPEMGINQLNIYYKASSSGTWLLVDKASYVNTFIPNNNTISLLYATTTISNISVPANINQATHDIKLIRETPHVPYVTYTEGAKLSARDLRISNLQLLHLIEEEANLRGDSVSDTVVYVNDILTEYYTIEQINNIIYTQSITPWVPLHPYVIGDVVVHDDPNTPEHTLRLWSCIAAHTSGTTNAPSATGGGTSFWEPIAPEAALGNLPYVKKFPGHDVDNFITLNDPETYGLVIEANDSQVADLLQTKAKSGDVFVTINNLGSLVVSSFSSLIVEGSTFLGHGSGGVYVNFTGGTVSGPAMHIRGTVGDRAMAVWKSTAPNTTDTSHLVFEVSDLIIRNHLDTELTGNYTEFTGEAIGISGTTTQNCLGTWNTDGGGKVFTGVRVGRDIAVGTVNNCTDNVWTSRINLAATTGHITTTGNLTCGTATADTLKTNAVVNADYLKTDASGTVIAGTGNPSITRLTIDVVGSNTNITARKAVYLDNTTGVWTYASNTQATTLAMGVVDNISGSAQNQAFSVVMMGIVAGYTGLVVGNWYWLGSNGDLLNTVPSGSGAIVDPVGFAISNTQLYVTPGRAHKLPVTA